MRINGNYHKNKENISYEIIKPICPGPLMPCYFKVVTETQFEVAINKKRKIRRKRDFSFMVKILTIDDLVMKQIMCTLYKIGNVLCMKIFVIFYSIC